MASYSDIEPTEHPGYGEQTIAADSALRTALGQLDNTIGAIDAAVGKMLERIAPLCRPDEPMPSPDQKVAEVTPRHSEIVRVVDDMAMRLRALERRVNSVHSDLEI